MDGFVVSDVPNAIETVIDSLRGCTPGAVTAMVACDGIARRRPPLRSIGVSCSDRSCHPFPWSHAWRESPRWTPDCPSKYLLLPSIVCVARLCRRPCP